ncbi:MAG: hypothetical protein LUE61_09235 [Clostridiales bacterium]|nr:hypothetical protein [Clostridiales bacterium]
MAEKRMFTKAIVNSARFLRMPPSSRLLYYDLGMAADDDGFCEAFTVMQTTGATEDDLNPLVDRKLVVILNDDLVVYIVDWKRNNYIQKDRYHESIYHSWLEQLEAASVLDTTCIQPVSKLDTQIRSEKSSTGLVKGRTVTVQERGAGGNPQAAPSSAERDGKTARGQFENVWLSWGEYAALTLCYDGEEQAQRAIKALSIYKHDTGKEYSSDYQALKDMVSGQLP